MIKFTVLIVLIAMLSIAMLSCFIFVWKKLGKKRFVLVTSITIWLLATIYFIGTGVTLTSVYVVKSKEVTDHYKAYESVNFEISNGNFVPISGDTSTYIVNESDMTLILEEVFYGIGSGDRYFSESPEMSMEIKPHDTEVVEFYTYNASIDHFFADVPPSEVTQDEKSKGMIALWLREKTSLENLKDNLEEHILEHNSNDKDNSNLENNDSNNPAE